VDADARLARSRDSGSTERRALDTSLVAAFDGEFDDSSDTRMREVGDGRNFTRDFAREVVCDGSVAELEAPVGGLRGTDGSRAFVLFAREGSACDSTRASAEDGAGLVLGGAESEDFIEVTERHARSATRIAAIEVRADRGADRHREPPKIGIPAERARKMRAAVGAFPSESPGRLFSFPIAASLGGLRDLLTAPVAAHAGVLRMTGVLRSAPLAQTLPRARWSGPTGGWIGHAETASRAPRPARSAPWNDTETPRTPLFSARFRDSAVERTVRPRPLLVAHTIRKNCRPSIS